MTKKPTVSICIPAYNEERNITNLLNSIKKQSIKSFRIESIKVYSDGSTDKTAYLVRKFFKDVVVREFKVKKGKIKRVNQILSSNKADILVLADADIEIKTSNVIKKLVDVYKDGKADLVLVHHIANKPNSLIGRVGYFGFKFWDGARKSLGLSGIRYYSEGGLISLSRRLSKIFRVPETHHVADDSYLFYFAVGKGYGVQLAPLAEVYVNLAERYFDYAKQMKRHMTDSGMVREKFDQRLVERYETLSSAVKLRSLGRELLSDPVNGVLYIAIQIFLKLQMPFYKANVGWVPITRGENK